MAVQTRRVIAVAIAIVLIAPGATLGTPAAHHSVKGLVDIVMRKGASAQLPVRLCRVLGVAEDARQTPVRQAVIREAGTVRAFNVCASRREDVITHK